VIDVVERTAYYNLKANPHRFYLVDAFMPTDCRKTSPGGIMGMRYLDFSTLIPNFNSRKNYTTAEVAAMLEGSTWT
jgi:hypothetical protein